MSVLEHQERIIKDWWAHTLSCMLDFLIGLNGRVLEMYVLCFVDDDLLSKDFVNWQGFDEMMYSLGLPAYAARVEARFLIYIDDKGVKILVTSEDPLTYGGAGDMLYYENVFSELNAGVLYEWSGREFIRTDFNEIYDILSALIGYTAEGVATWDVDLARIKFEYDAMLRKLCADLSARFRDGLVQMR